MRPSAVLVAVALVACVQKQPSSRPALPAPRERVILTDDAGQRYRSLESVGPVESAVQAPIDSVWSALPAIYESLGIPVAHLDRPAGQIGNKAVVRSGRLAGERLSRSFDCGASMTGQRADQARITASVITQLWQMPEGRTGIATTIGATMKPLDGTSTAPASCTSTGFLEKEIETRLRTRLGA